MDDCIFCRIARGEHPEHVIHEDDLVVAFPDIRPLRPGHVQVISREHAPYFEDMTGATAARVIHVGQKLARAMKRLYGVPRVGFIFSGGDISHAHAHVFPVFHKYDITSAQFFQGHELTFTEMPLIDVEERAATAARLRAALDPA
jgi:histidine triad (HIT) family protein